MYFNGMAISTSFVLSAVGCFRVIFALNSNNSESFLLSLESSFWYFHRRPDDFAELWLYSIRLVIICHSIISLYIYNYNNNNETFLRYPCSLQ